MKENKEKAFTLIELLAIIVILAIIAVITVPIILNIIEDSKKGAIQDSAYGYKEAIQNNYLKELSKAPNGNTNLDGQYTIGSNGNLSGTNNLEILSSGEKPSGGYISIEDKKISGCI